MPPNYGPIYRSDRNLAIRTTLGPLQTQPRRPSVQVLHIEHIKLFKDRLGQAYSGDNRGKRCFSASENWCLVILANGQCVSIAYSTWMEYICCFVPNSHMHIIEICETLLHHNCFIEITCCSRILAPQNTGAKILAPQIIEITCYSRMLAPQMLFLIAMVYTQQLTTDTEANPRILRRNYTTGCPSMVLFTH